jgi:hypothetical protein
VLQSRDIAEEIRAILEKERRPLRAEEILNQASFRERLLAQAGTGSAAYFAAANLVREALQLHLKAEVSFVEIDIDDSGHQSGPSARTRKLIPVYSLR